MHALRSQLVVICLLAGLGVAQLAAAQSRLPERGLDKSAVETRFGAPQRIEGPVGEPPITKWIYADFIVVFEYEHVVHTVHRQTAVEQGSVVPPNQETTPAPTSPASGTGTGTGADSGTIGGAATGTQSSDETAGSADRQTGGDTLNIPQ